jgi:hypothetical protein
MADPAVASDIPTRFDVALAGKGYVFLDTITPSLPFRQHKAVYSLSPTFINRQNVSGNFGDNQQDWWLTSSQVDWSEGENQKFFRLADSQSRSSFWKGSAVDISIPGQIGMAIAQTTTSFATSAVSSATGTPGGLYAISGGNGNLYEISTIGVVTDRGGHGASLAGGVTAIVTDNGTNAFISGASSTVVRKWNGAAFSTFSATPASALAFLNNSLYGINASTLVVYDTAGAASIKGTWKTADGSAAVNAFQLQPFGGKLAILRYANGPNGAELWIYDGTGVFKVADFPDNFYPYSFCVSMGIIWILGLTSRLNKLQGALFYYNNGTLDVAWRADRAVTGVNTQDQSICPYATGVLFTDAVDGTLRFYDLTNGSFSTLAAYTASGNSGAMAATQAPGSQIAMHVNGTSTAVLINQNGASAATSSTMSSSLFDFDSSLDKFVKSVKVDYEPGTDGNGGSVDVAYRTNSLNSNADTYTTAQIGIAAGSEASISQSCRSLGLKVTLNKGTSTYGPVLKRTYLRAAPVLDQFKNRELVIDCSGDGGLEARELRDGTTMVRSGREQVEDLILLAQTTTPFTVVDRFTSFNALVDLSDPEGFQIYEIHQADDLPAQSGTFVVRLKLRQV